MLLFRQFTKIPNKDSNVKIFEDILMSKYYVNLIRMLKISGNILAVGDHGPRDLP